MALAFVPGKSTGGGLPLSELGDSDLLIHRIYAYLLYACESDTFVILQVYIVVSIFVFIDGSGEQIDSPTDKARKVEDRDHIELSIKCDDLWLISVKSKDGLHVARASVYFPMAGSGTYLYTVNNNFGSSGVGVEVDGVRSPSEDSGTA